MLQSCFAVVLARGLRCCGSLAGISGRSSSVICSSLRLYFSSWMICSVARSTLPLSSPGRLGRVVALTVYHTFICSASLREIVLLPTPEGPQRTRRRPGCLLGCAMSFEGCHLSFVTGHSWLLLATSDQ